MNMRDQRVVTVLRTLPASLLFAALASGSALAQQTETQAAEPAAGPARATARGALEEIVVTATRREESLSKVPVSISALSQETMDQKGIKDFQDIARYLPGVNIDLSGTNAISIRGISSSGGPGTTGIYIDDTPIQMRSIGFNPDDTLPKTFDLERVEVLRGPQGTLFGSGSEGGTVRYIMAQPKVSGSGTYVRSELSYTDYANQPNYEAGVAHGGTLIDGVLGYRISAWYRADAGWIDRVDPTTRVTTEHNINYGGATMLRLAALWQPTSALAITPSILYQNSYKHDQSTYWPAYSNPSAGDFNTATPENMPIPDRWYLPALKIVADVGRTQIFSNTSYYNRREQDAYQGTVYDLAYFQSLGWPTNPNTGFIGLGCGSASTVPNVPCSWYPLENATGLHLPKGFANYSTPNNITNNQDSYVQELRWQSNDDTSPWRWTIGAFWQLAKEESIEQLIDKQNNSFFEALYGQTYEYIVSQGNGFPSPYYSCPGQTPGYVYPAIPQCDIYYNRNTTYDRQIAGFGEVTYSFNEHWKLTAGERVARTSFSLEHYSDGLENYGPSNKSAENTETPSTPKVSVAYQMDLNNLFYATYAKGFRVGGGNAPLPPYCDSDLTTAGYPGPEYAPLKYKSDSTNSYEIGAKNNFGPALRVASSVYYTKWQNIQQNIYVAGACGLQFIDNVGTAVAKGFDMQAEIAAGPMHFDVAIGYTDAQYSADSSPHPNLSHKGDAISGQAAIDYAPGLNPPWDVALGAEYEFRIRGYDSFVRFDYQYASSNPWPSTLQDPSSHQFIPNTYTLSSSTYMQMRAGMVIGGWTAALFVDNLANSHTVTNYALGQYDAYRPPLLANGNGHCTTEPCSVQQNQYTFRPRTIGVSVSYRTN
jgi:iron complex outermembrane recepter protein